MNGYKKPDRFTPKHIINYFNFARALRVSVNRNIESIHDVNSRGDTKLHIAASHGYLAAMDIALDSGAAVNAENSLGFTAMHCAAYYGHTQAVKILYGTDGAHVPDNFFDFVRFHGKEHMLGEFAKVNLLPPTSSPSPSDSSLDESIFQFVDADNNLSESMLRAVKAGDIERVTAFINESGIEAKDTHGNSMLMHAAGSNNLKLVRLLLDQGANIDIVNENLENVLMHAVRSNNTEMLTMLLDKGAYIMASDLQEKNALMVAVSEGNVEIAEFILEKMQSISAKEIDRPDKRGNTPLIYAVRANNLVMLNMLLDKGANIEAVNELGQRALQVAAVDGNVALTEWLLNEMLAIDENAINIPDRFGDTMLMHAVKNNDFIMLNMLLDRGGGYRGSE